MTALASSCSACGANYRELLTNCPNCQAPIYADAPRIGEIFDGKYEILARLGAGGMGEVFKARHVHLGTERAIKVMNRDLTADEASRRRFSREARLATGIHHRNIAVVFDFAVAPNGSDYIVSELIEGITLREWITMPEKYSQEAALDIALQALEGIDYLHRAGILHRDISPDNLMIATDENGANIVKIIDLGLAKLLATEPRGGDSTTRAGLFLGSPRYSSPEQLGALPDGAEIDERSDVYSFGVVLYELLAGVPPFASATPQGYAVKHLTERPPPLTARPGTRPIRAALQRVVWRALEKKRELRYGSARELANALMPFVASWDEPEPEPEPLPVLVPVPPPSDGGLQPAPQPVAWKPALLIGATVVIALVAALLYRRRDDVPLPPPPASQTATHAVTTTSAAIPPLALTGRLVIDATPWGRIVSINDGKKEWVTGDAAYTPQTMKLPVGNYTVALLGPDGTQQSVVVGLTSTEPAYVKIEFHDCAGCTANSKP